MEKVFQSVDEVLADEDFLAWYFKSDEIKAAEWNNWMKQNPSVQYLVHEAVQTMQYLQFNENELNQQQIEAAHSRLMNNISPNIEGKVIRSSLFKRWGWVAAAVIVVFIAGGYYWSGNLTTPKSIISTSYGQVQFQKLPDGTEVTLNANSTISYSTDWDHGKEREVWIKGEAYFHVIKMANKSRFIVHTDQLDVVVTGTQFNVVNREGHTNVMLTEGSVLLHTKNGNEISMKPGDFVEFNHDHLEKKDAKEEAVLAWRERKLVFENTPVREVVQKIRDEYGVQIEVEDDTLNSKMMSGFFPNDNLDILLKMMEASAEFKVVRKENKIVLMNP
jgi:ferric-dicitrate binding protein FerR (iron transport regulator)